MFDHYLKLVLPLPTFSLGLERTDGRSCLVEDRGDHLTVKNGFQRLHDLQQEIEIKTMRDSPQIWTIKPSGVEGQRTLTFLRNILVVK